MIPVAVKTLTSRDPDVIKKFYEEADLMKKFSHANIVSLLGKLISSSYICRLLLNNLLLVDLLVCRLHSRG